MRDPKLGPLPADVARLLEAERDRQPDSFERSERILERVRTTLAAPPVGDGGRGGVWPALTKGKLGGALAAVFVAGAFSGAVGYARFASSHDASPARQDAVVACVPEAKVLEPLGTAIRELPPALPLSDSPAAPKQNAAVSQFPSATPSSLMVRDVDLGRERALVDMARSALGRGSVASALAALSEHERAFPNGRLREERDAMFIQILAQSGDQAEASRRATAFRRGFPSSMLLPAIEAALSATRPDASFSPVLGPTGIER